MAVMLLSRVFGFLREWTVAHQLGSSGSPIRITRRLPSPISLVISLPEAHSGMFFIPVFAKYTAEKNEEEGWHVYSTIITLHGLNPLYPDYRWRNFCSSTWFAYLRRDLTSAAGARRVPHPLDASLATLSCFLPA